MPSLLARIRALGSVAVPVLPDGLSAREVEILRLVSRGLSNRRIGAELIISEHTAANPCAQHPAQDGLCKPRGSSLLRAPARPGRALTVRYDGLVPLYVVSRESATQLELTGFDVRQIEDINADEGVGWVFTFLSADRRRSYCLFEAPSPDAIVTAVQRAGLPTVDVITEVDRLYPLETVG